MLTKNDRCSAKRQNLTAFFRWPYVFLFVCLSARVFVCLFVCQSTRVFVRWAVGLPLCLFVSPLVCFVCLSDGLSVSYKLFLCLIQSTCLSIILSNWFFVHVCVFSSACIIACV